MANGDDELTPPGAGDLREETGGLSPPGALDLSELESMLRQGINEAGEDPGADPGSIFRTRFSEGEVFLGYTGDPLPIPYGPRATTDVGPLAGIFKQTEDAPKPRRERFVPYDEARMMPLRWSDQEVKEFVNKGIANKVPGFDVGMGMPEIQDNWQTLVQQSMQFNSQSEEGEKWTPWDVMDSYAEGERDWGTMREGDWVYDIATGERLKYVGPKTKTVKRETVDLSSPEDVNVLVKSSLTELLGRAPNDQELAQFRTSINALERESPLVTETTQTLEAVEGGERGMELEVVGEETQRTGGISQAARQDLIAENVKETGEYASYQAATTYWDAMMGMVAGG